MRPLRNFFCVIGSAAAFFFFNVPRPPRQNCSPRPPRQILQKFLCASDGYLQASSPCVAFLMLSRPILRRVLTPTKTLGLFFCPLLKTLGLILGGGSTICIFAEKFDRLISTDKSLSSKIRSKKVNFWQRGKLVLSNFDTCKMDKSQKMPKNPPTLGAFSQFYRRSIL